MVDHITRGETPACPIRGSGECMFDALNVHNFITSIQTYGWWRVITEWIIIGAVIFWILRFLQGTRGARMLKGIAVVLISTYLVVSLVADKFGFDRIAFLYERFLYVAALAIVVVFQPELRRALMRIGETRLFHSYSTQVGDEIDAIVTAVGRLSESVNSGRTIYRHRAGCGAGRYCRYGHAA